jgi:DNA repair exonuclease SbcCD ATPase subunit
MPDIHARTQAGEAAYEPVEVVREQRIDPPHRLGDPPPDEAQSKVVVAQVSDATGSVEDDIERASLVVVQQLRSQAQQLAAHLQRQQADLDRRESEQQAHAAEIEQQARNNRLWLKERHTEQTERDRELHRREAELADRARLLHNLEYDRASDMQRERDELVELRERLERREAAVRQAEQSVRGRAAEVESAAAAVEEAGMAHDQLSRELDERAAQFDDRLGWCLDALSGFLERGAVPMTRPTARTAGGDVFDALADLLHRLAQRRKNLDQTEAMLAAAARDMNQRRAAGEPTRSNSPFHHDGAADTRLNADQLLAQVRRLLAENVR